MKIINILSETFSYNREAFESNPPAIEFTADSGVKIGIWRDNCWPVMMGQGALSMSKALKYEVWQPSFDVDRLYERQFNDGLIYKIYPAVPKKYFEYFKPGDSWHSREMEKDLIALSEDRRNIIHLNYYRSPDVIRILTILKKTCAPILIQSHGSTLLPIEEMKNIRNPFNLHLGIFLLMEQFALRRKLRRAACVTGQNHDAVNRIKKIYKGHVDYLTMFCDFNYWMKYEATKKIGNINLKNKITFLISSNIIKRKQVDVILKIFLKLSDRFDNFFVIIAGRFIGDYGKVVLELGKKLEAKGLGKMCGHIVGDELKDLYNNSDIFVNVSISEGASVAVMKALAMELSVFSTTAGGTADFMQSENCGVIVDIHDYQSWEKQMVGILKGSRISKADRRRAKAQYDIKSVIRSYFKCLKKISPHFREHVSA